MAGNVQADNSGNIFVEFDYNNIIVVDPNKTIDPVSKKISERLVDHENLVMYANLEAEVLPRTKLAVGASPEDRLRLVSVAKINFLKPTKDAFLGTGYYDELTGENSTKFKGTNQMLEETAPPKDGQKAYVTDRPADLKNIFDNGLLGITNIQIDTNLSFIPTVRISLEDVQGRALFQLGNNSPYAAFFNLPYPPFYLTLKGYYGQAVRYQLNLEKFNARFNTFSGNYQIELDFRGYKFNILNEIAVGHLLATPHMYSQQFNVTANPVGPQTSQKSQENNAAVEGKLQTINDGRQTEETVQVTTERGYEKIKEVYSEYKAKGLVPQNFPEYSLPQFINALDIFLQNVQNQFDKVEVAALTNIRDYRTILRNYFDGVRGGPLSWFNRYLNPAPYIKTDGTRIYTFKEIDLVAKFAAQTQLETLIANYNGQLALNPTLGVGGTDTITNPIKYETIAIAPPPATEINWPATTTSQTGILKPNLDQQKVEEEKYAVITTAISTTKKVDGKDVPVDSRPRFFVFEGDQRFDKEIALLEAEATKKLSFYEDIITKKLLEKLEKGTFGIGFKPTVRNIIAVLMASAEAFIRLMDDVHTTAWGLRYDDVRKKAILENPSSAPSTETVEQVKLTKQAYEEATGLKYAEIPVYPWPQFFVETPEDKKGRFQLKYVADPTVADLTGAWDFSKWPEVQFVEEYMRGLTMKFNPPLQPPPLDNELNTNLININAIEFPTVGVAYVNKEEIKFFYEIYERQLLTSRYSNYVRANPSQINELIKLNTETETNNILKSLGLNSPYITMKLKDYGLNSSNYLSVLQNISNGGTGRAWQDYIRDFFVTPYLRNLTENSFAILNVDDYGKIPQTTAKSTALQSLVNNSTNEPNITDTIPFTDTLWVQSNMADGARAVGNQVYNTNRVLTIFEPRRIISNFNNIYNNKEKRPVTNFSYLKTSNPYNDALGFADNFQNIGTFYSTRTPNDFVATEGYIAGVPPSIDFATPVQFQFPLLSTTSMMNTPYMVNAIQNGVQNQRNNDTYPFVQAAYLFINSLPLATLKEKYKTQSDSTQTDLDYIASCFKKFGAIHKLPYGWIVKMGSIWHRYKIFKQTGGDILRSAWTNFNYVSNFSPINNSASETYSFNYGAERIQITMQSESSTDVSMQTGFYPKVINDFFRFCNGYDVYKDYTNAEIQNTINGGMKVHNFVNSNILTTQGTRNLRLKTWSVLLPGGILESDPNCKPSSPTKATQYFIVPSFGSDVNQTIDVCINNIDSQSSTIVDLSSNPSVYNGSVRTFWSAPNYGYFDNNKIIIPPPDAYPKKIRPDVNEQSPFSLLDSDEYAKIEEIFSVFDKRILDTFEQEFLNFSKSSTDNDLKTKSNQIGASLTNIDVTYRNFQSLYTSLLTVVPQLTSTNQQEYFDNVIDLQYDNVQNLLRNFMEYDVLFKYGNPSNYKRRIFDSYLSYQDTPVVTDPRNFQPYIQRSLPTRGGTVTVQQSRANNPQAWTELELEVGFSTIQNLRYSDDGSYITDFFVDNNIEFTAANVQLLSPIIKMYATYKLRFPTNSVSQFKNQLQALINQENLLQSNFLNDLLTNLNKFLPNQSQIPQGTINSVVTGQQSKVENWEMFKALNDKWIAGGDYKTKTLFEDILFLDRASRNIGETVLIDIFDLKSMIGKDSLNNAMSVFTLISGILIKNNFTVMNLPAYVNFYNVQEVDGTTISQQEGPLEFANNMWGTFLNVDYRNSTSKMVCFYVGKPSQYLDLPKGNFRFRDDGFDMRRASENPLLENLNGKTDYALSNRCVGFNVDIGTRNQNIFYSFQVDQTNGVATSESINTTLNMVNQAVGKNVATQNVSLYNLYKQRSYKCSVVCLGNALIQPSMYFNLRHVPMFNGPYLIQSISHTIQPGNFQTTFTGIRQGIYDLPSIDSFLQSMNQNLLTKLEEVLQIKKDTPKPIANTQQQKLDDTVQKADNTLDAQNSCTTKVDVTTYQGYEVQSGSASNPGLTPRQFKEKLESVIKGTTQDDIDLRQYIYFISYVNSFVASSNSGAGAFVGFNNNYALISLDKNFGQGLRTFFSKRYCCVNVKTSGSNNSLPIVAFDSIEKYILFMEAALRNNIGRIRTTTFTKYYVCHWPRENVAESYFDANNTEFTTVYETLTAALKSAVDIGLVTLPKAQEEEKKNKKEIEDNKKPPAPTPVPPNPGQTCPPPVVNTFAPAIGNKGTIVQIKGRNLDATSKVFINGVQVEPKDLSILDAQTIRVVVPQVGDVRSTGNIKVETFYGDFTTVSTFTFDPKIEPSAASSPGSLVNNATDTTAAATAVNNNSQQTGPSKFITVTQTKNQIGGDQELVVKLDDSTSDGPYLMDTQPSIGWTFYTIKRGPNNTIVEEQESFVDSTRIVGFVSQDRKTFTCTRESLISAEFEEDIDEFLEFDIKIKIEIRLLAIPVDQTKKPVTTKYNFEIFVPSSRVEQGFGSISFIGEKPNSEIPNFNGKEYYSINNIDKGVYLVYKFNCPACNLDGFDVVSADNVNNVQNISVIGPNPETKYQNIIQVDAKGTFKLRIKYRNVGSSTPFTAMSTPFTL